MDLLDFDIILGMTWSSPYHTIINYNAKTMTLTIPKKDKLQWARAYKAKMVRITLFFWAKNFVGKGCLAFLSHL